MKILANRKMKALFCRIAACILAFALISVSFIVFEARDAALYILLCALAMGIVILAACYGYFKDQNRIMEDAVEQIAEYISGNREARIACDEEGELYRLFHEVNSLVAILNASAENERRSKQFLKNTISDISHQLKTPLAALNIYNGLMQGETEGLPELQEFAALSEKELDRIETLVQNLLKITKLDAGSIVFEKNSENVADILGEVELHFAYRAKQEQKELILVGDSHVSLFCDHDWMIEAIENIVKNAFDHTEPGDFIRIEWKQSASMVQISIKDKQGIGLGLPLAKMIIEAHRGTIEVDSELGIGTTFTLSFLIPTKL